ncbi:hypothetical protein TNCV_51391 [Trichonephila clavipes]|nr:hypothetical protein TNCV_51391 [Trichonephila clavipes]
MVEVKPINISLNQHSPSLSVRTAISPTLTEEFIIHPSVYSEIEKLGHAKSDVLLSESGSSLSVDYDSPLVSMEIPLRTAYSQAGRCGMQPKAKHKVFARRRIELKLKNKKLLDIRAEKEKRRTRELRLRAKTAWLWLHATIGQPDCTLSAAVRPWRPEENLKHTKRRNRQGLYDKYTKI